MLFVLPGNPNNMRSMISSCCLMLKLVSLFHHINPKYYDSPDQSFNLICFNIFINF